MLVNEQFLRAKGSKEVTDLYIVSRDGRNYMRLRLEERSKYYESKKVNSFVEADTEIEIDNYSRILGRQFDIGSIFFCCSLNYLTPCHVRTFLDAIKKNTEVKFIVVAYEYCDHYKENNLNLVNHILYGLVNDKCYLLSNFVGLDAPHNNSPVS